MRNKEVSLQCGFQTDTINQGEAMPRTAKERLIDMLYLIAAVAMGIWVAYTKGWILADFPKVDGNTALAMIREGNVTLLDVRTPEEYRQGHLQGATLLPVGTLESHLDALGNDLTKPIVVYCRSGSRSLQASRILKRHGFHPVDVKDGIVSLIRAGAALEKP